VRQAFNYAANTEAIVREVTKIGRTAGDILPPGMLGHDPDLQGYPYHPAQAKRFLAEAGYPDGAGFPVVQLWSVHQAASTKAELAAYQRYLADLGVSVEIHFARDWPTYKAMLERGELPMFRLIRYATIPDTDYFLFPMLHSTSPTNYTFYRNTQVDARIEQARQEMVEGRRIALYREVARMVLDDAPWINQHHSVLEYLYQPYVQGMEDSVLGHQLLPMKKVWFKKDPAEGLMRTATEGQPSR
jgi:ABC-type transport system substrate-binding protein